MNVNLKRILIAIYTVTLVLSALALSERNFRMLNYGRVEEVFPWIFMFFSSAISLYFLIMMIGAIGKTEGVLSLWLKRKKLEEEKRIKELQDK
ncbi:hypothetical protein [Klebsiella pneumoniae]|jgi:hypothetical protein|uniref:hypothetical protein n=1 Tax=Klebsiella pneumoniae TaxID=573 RepID=UPI000EFB7404|nr:hypothetical protein [Klebsiella pneumoniae]MCB8847281.1 hypothetical protein [Klebsiella pneumoniae]MCB8872886.1 hypothetical protein [Klebsiella pneumoniae]